MTIVEVDLPAHKNVLFYHIWVTCDEKNFNFGPPLFLQYNKTSELREKDPMTIVEVDLPANKNVLFYKIWVT